jgi:hypothetical protein
MKTETPRYTAFAATGVGGEEGTRSMSTNSRNNALKLKVNVTVGNILIINRCTEVK